MTNLINTLKTHKILILILLIALFFRTYEVIDRFEFAHDGDLYSWIVKDIVVNGHPRLIGQLTTAPGIYIGPFFYYMLIPFFILTKMDPIGAIIPITIVSIFTVFSYWWVFKKLFNPTVGLIGAFLYGVLLWVIQLDRRVVPSTPTNLWVVWYFYTLINLVRGNFNVLWILAILIALVWHIHIALAPALFAAPIAILFSRKWPTKKQILVFFIFLFIFSLPLIMFEAKHGFIQTQSFIKNLSFDQGGGNGYSKFIFLSYKATLNLINLIFSPENPIFLKDTPILVATLLSGLLLVKKNLIRLSEVLTLIAWIIGIFGFYTFSSTVISEYYLSNIEIIYIMIFSLWIFYILKFSKAWKIIMIGFLGLLFLRSFIYITSVDYYHKGYIEKKSIVEYIKKDSLERGFPCISVSYITTPGENVGFRYFFYLNNLHVNSPSSGSPVYTIVLPDELANGRDEKIFGHIKVIPPDQIPTKEEIVKSCSGQNSNLTDPLLGYTE